MKRQILLVIVLALATAACDRVQLLAPTDSELTLTAAATFLSPSGTTTVSAFVIESAGTPVQNGTTVRFTTTLGRVEPAEAQTSNGLATTTFFADGASGLATIRATSGSATAEDGIEILVGTGAVTDVVLRANPANVAASGGTVTVSARVTGEDGQGLAGIPVSFSTTSGTLSSTTAVTDANGDATVQLTTNREATITAIAGGVSATEVTVEVAAAATVTLSATAAAAGLPTSLTVTPATGTAPRVTINWGDGESSELGIVSAATTVAHVYEAPGTFTITGSATDNGETTTTSTTVTIPVDSAIDIAFTPAAPTSADTVIFTVTPSTAQGVQNVTVDFGDGNQRDLGAVTRPTQTDHKYTAAGTYIARVLQTTTSGAVLVDSTSVTVTEAP